MASDTASAGVGAGRMVPQDVELDGRDYTIRHYRAEDRGEVCSLYGTVGGSDRDGWFDWTFEDNPATESVPMTVGTHDGTVVAAKPATAYRLTCEGRTYVALGAGDALVHPEHRGRGLAAETTEALTVAYEHGDADLFFTVSTASPPDRSAELDWRSVGRVPVHCRLHRPAAMVSATGGPTQLAVRTAGGVGRATLGFLDLVRGTTDHRVRAHDDPPVGTLRALYRVAEPDGLHAVRDGEYLRWRYRHPDWHYRTYVAVGDDGPVSAIVVGRSRTGDDDVACLTDVFPLDPDRRSPDATTALLARVVGDNHDADCLRIAGRSIRASTLARFGFVDESRPLIRRLTAPGELLVRPCDERLEDPWRIHGRELTDPETWSFGFAEAHGL